MKCQYQVSELPCIGALVRFSIRFLQFRECGRLAFCFPSYINLCCALCSILEWGLCSCFSFLFCTDVYVLLYKYQDYWLLHFNLCFYVIVLVCGPVVSKQSFMLRSVTPRVVFLTFYLPLLRGSNPLVSPIILLCASHTMDSNSEL